ncbi:hypothetical protein GCM10010252_55550 [Streptomyces aureoverticillatus]|nr:hypothetical protein GCM10010252_55550 [Streptomyces aureoverticillatus]
MKRLTPVGGRMTDDDVTDGEAGDVTDDESADREARDAALRRRLRGAGHAHRPDRERMLARVERGMAGARDGTRAPRAPRARRGREEGASWLRVAGTTAAVAGVFAAGGYGVATAVRDDPDTRTVATTPSTPPAASVPAPPTAEPDRTKRPPRRPASGSPPATQPAGPPASSRPPASPKPPRTAAPGAGLVRADGRIDPGSNPYWSQSDITVRAQKPLTALTVELRVARSGEVADTGNWRSLPAEDFDVSVRERDGFLVYRWTLRAGRTVPAGQHVFAGQYNHPAGERDAGDDTYALDAGAAGERGEWKGGFEPGAG